MKTEVTPEQVAQFQRDGFVVIEGFLDGDELQRWREVTEEAVEQRLSSEHGLHNRDADEFYKNVFTQCLRLIDTHEGMNTLLTDPRLGKLAATLSGVDGVRLWHDQALFKQPYGNQTAWHRDVPYWAFHSRKSVSLWFPLDDATLANGCLWYLPGTHLLGDYKLTRIGSNMLDQFKAYPDWLEIEAVPAPCPAGSVVVHNGMIVHGAGANMTPRARRVMTAVYYPDGELYNGNPDTLPEVYYRNLTAGDRLDDDRYVPLVWHLDRDQSQA